MSNIYIDRRVSGVIRYSCAFLFVAFSLTYLYFMQGDLLSEAQFVYSHGLTSYSIPIGAVVITVVLQIIQKVQVNILRFNWQYYALSYFPSLFLLGLLTGITHDDLPDFHWGCWSWLIPIAFVLYFVLVYLQKDKKMMIDSVSELLWRNYIILFAFILMCGAIPRTNEVHQYEFSVERHIVQKDYEGALNVAQQSLHSTRRLTELRMYALARKGLLAECLFDYPQYYMGEGLLSVSDSDSIYRYPPLKICVWLGAVPDGVKVRTTYQYLWALNAVDSLRTQRTQDYFLCYLLLQKKLKEFQKELVRFYPDSICPRLPRAYSEAVVYINNVYGENLQYTIDPKIIDRFRLYEQRKESIQNETERNNLLRREFGNTFWWYYELSKSATTKQLPPMKTKSSS